MVEDKEKIDYGGQNLCFNSDLTSQFELEQGQLVRSIAGRDKGKHYLVMAVEKNYVLLVDGSSRSIVNPKKKNTRHLQKCNKIAADFIGKIAAGRLTDEDVRGCLKQLLTKA